MVKKRLRMFGKSLAIFAVAIVLIFTIIYFIPFDKTEWFKIDAYRYGADYFKELDNIPILRQETGYTCYIVSMVIVKNYLGFETTEHELISGLGLSKRSGGMLPNDYLNYSDRIFTPLSVSVSLINPTSQTERHKPK